MAMDTHSVLAVLLIVGATLPYFLSGYWKPFFYKLPYPPGPPGSLIAGNAKDIPSKKPWVIYANWAKQYGDIVYFRIYRQHTIVLSSMEDCIELFEKRAKIYSDRPETIMMGLMGWDFNVGLMPYSNEWRQHRKLFQQQFRPSASLKYRPIQMKKVHDMLRGILASPEDFRAHFRTLAAAVVMSAMYGYDIAPTNDYFTSLAEQAVAKLSDSILPGAAVVNAIPMFRHLPAWFPGAAFKRYANEAKKLTTAMQVVPFKLVKERMAAGTADYTMVSGVLEDLHARGGPKDYEAVVQHVAATAYAAGADTTVSSIGTMFYALSTHPEVQKKAQNEIDTIVGPHRLPTFEDRSSLPYTEAIFREILRWRPVLPLGVYHGTSEDDVYKGYFIPKGTTVIPNAWALGHNEATYPQPELFNPERFFDKDGKLNSDDVGFVFGFGRRICPGRHMASTTVWLALVSILATFDLKRAKDAAGNEIPISGEYTDGLVSHPLNHECSITLRSEEVRRLIVQSGGVGI
ncbi:cytochrome P450 [Crucibulum laeve]|uniref:Cytochrome P450 n=1 Tax=Crucibulum laeve TaxID=68775 RepID=A0A5C3M9M4_9AGAR|nr:cytochrome P450 [Crucibulum laeve]